MDEHYGHFHSSWRFLQSECRLDQIFRCKAFRQAQLDMSVIYEQPTKLKSKKALKNVLFI